MKDTAKLTALGAVLGLTEVLQTGGKGEMPETRELTIVPDEEVQALTIMPPPNVLAVSRPPKQVLAEAKDAADALIEVIKAKKNPFKINGEVYLQFEDWQTVAKFYGATVKITETNFVQYDEVAGFEAKAVVINSNGMEISGAEAMCLNDEAKWGMRPKYKWVNGERQKVGEEPTPLFQLKSMAQTRASAKALRNVFAWVVVLAGYKPTPAEEMDGVKPAKAQEELSLETIEGIIEKPTMSGGSLWFYLGEDVCNIPPMKGQDMKTLLGQADKAFVELKVTPINKTKGGKEYRIVKEIVKFEPSDTPF